MTTFTTDGSFIYRGPKPVERVDPRRAVQALLALGMCERSAQAIASGALATKAGASALAKARGLVA